MWMHKNRTNNTSWSNAWHDFRRHPVSSLVQIRTSQMSLIPSSVMAWLSRSSSLYRSKISSGVDSEAGSLGAVVVVDNEDADADADADGDDDDAFINYVYWSPGHLLNCTDPAHGPV